jgi:hypothetical protein
MSKARSNLFVFTDKRLMKKTVGNLTDFSHSAAGSNRLSQAFARLSAGLVLWFLVLPGVSDWSYLFILVVLICCPVVSTISASAGPGSLASRHQPCLVSFRSDSNGVDFTVDA